MDFGLFQNLYHIHFWSTGIAGRKEDELSMSLLMLVIAMVISLNEVRENNTGMALQIRASGNKKKVRTIRTVQYGIYAALLVIPVFVPYLLKVNQDIGLYGVRYPAMSLHMFPSWAGGLPIIAILFLTAIIRMVLASAGAVIFSFLIRKSSDISIAFPAGLFVLVMPFAVLYLLI